MGASLPYLNAVLEGVGNHSVAGQEAEAVVELHGQNKIKQQAHNNMDDSDRRCMDWGE